MKWEYKIVWVGDPAGNVPMAQDRLNNTAREGWQLIAIDRGYGYFSRPAKEASAGSD